MKSMIHPHNFPFTARLVAAIVLINIAVIAIIAYSLYLSRRHYDEQAAAITRSIAQVLDENISGAIAQTDLALLSVVDEAQRQLRSGPIDKESLSSFIVRTHSRMPELAAMRAANASGDAIYGRTTKAVTTTSLAHRNYFRYLRDNPDAELAVSEPLAGGISGTWMVVMARRISSPDGTFAGLVYAGYAIERFVSLFSKIDMGRRASVTLYTRDFTIVARYQGDGGIPFVAGQKVNPVTLSGMLREGKRSGTYTAKSIVDGIVRRYNLKTSVTLLRQDIGNILF
jgi:hypothetical protein